PDRASTARRAAGLLLEALGLAAAAPTKLGATLASLLSAPSLPDAAAAVLGVAAASATTPATPAAGPRSEAPWTLTTTATTPTPTTAPAPPASWAPPAANAHSPPQSSGAAQPSPPRLSLDESEELDTRALAPPNLERVDPSVVPGAPGVLGEP